MSNQIKNKTKIYLTGEISGILIFVTVLIFISGIVCLISFTSEKNETIFDTKHIYNYSNAFSGDSKINLKENNFIKEEDIDESQTYLADVISDIDLDMKYNYMKDISSSDIANFIRLNRSYLFKLFKQQTGMSVSQYLMQYRINKACEFLSEYNFSVGQIAQMVGIDDIYYLHTFCGYLLRV